MSVHRHQPLKAPCIGFVNVTKSQPQEYKARVLSAGKMVSGCPTQESLGQRVLEIRLVGSEMKYLAVKHTQTSKIYYGKRR
jgi:hypothetical protein